MNKTKVLNIIIAIIAAVSISIAVYAALPQHAGTLLDTNVNIGIGDIGIGIDPLGGGGDGGGGDEEDEDEDVGGNLYANVDITNLGPDAYDFAVVIKGQHVFDGTGDTDHFDGNGVGASSNPGEFSSFTATIDTDADTTTLHWEVWQDPDTDPADRDKINTNQTIHLGWCVDQTGLTDVVDMYWTDRYGNRIEGSIVYVIDLDERYETKGGIVKLRWDNVFDASVPITIQDVHVAGFTTPIALADLNNSNPILSDNLKPVNGAESFTVPHGYRAEFELNVPVPPGTAVVVRYKATGPGSDGVVTNFHQFIVE